MLHQHLSCSVGICLGEACQEQLQPCQMLTGARSTKGSVCCCAQHRDTASTVLRGLPVRFCGEFSAQLWDLLTGRGKKSPVFQPQFMKKITVYVCFGAFFLLKMLVLTFTRHTFWNLGLCALFPGENPTAKQRMLFSVLQDCSKRT